MQYNGSARLHAFARALRLGGFGLCALALPFAARASGIIHVPADYPNIQKAINNSVDGNTILVADGTYTGPGNFNIDFNGKNVTVASENGAAACTIDCQQNGRAFLFQNGETNATLRGFTIVNGLAHDQGGAIYIHKSSPFILDCMISSSSVSVPSLAAQGFGGGIYADNSQAHIAGCTITGNYIFTFAGSVQGAGGGVCLATGADCILFGNTISSNLIYGAGYGGGFYISAANPIVSYCNLYTNDNSIGAGGGGMAVVNHAAPRIDNTIFKGNTCPLGGGIFYAGNAEGTLDHCTVASNMAANGGGIAIIKASTPKITQTVVQSNAAHGGAGGGIAIRDSSYPVLEGCAITANTSDNGGGGGIYLDGSKLTLINTTLVGNNAANNMNGVGGGLCLVNSSGAIVTNCTFTRNKADKGGAVQADSSTATITNSILWKDTPDEIHTAGVVTTPPIVTYSDVAGGFVGTGNISADPLFADPANGDVHIKIPSPCIDKGSSLAPLLPATDKDGNPRVDGPAPDMGAYEVIIPASVTGVLDFEGIVPFSPAHDVTFEFRPLDGSPGFTVTQSVPASGGFQINGVTRKNYLVHIKGSIYLADNVVVNALSGSVTGVHSFQAAGDATHDNRVGIADFGALVNAYGGTNYDPTTGYDKSADFNGDGANDIADFGLLVGNYGSVGAP